MIHSGAQCYSEVIPMVLEKKLLSIFSVTVLLILIDVVLVMNCRVVVLTVVMVDKDVDGNLVCVVVVDDVAESIVVVGVVVVVVVVGVVVVDVGVVEGVFDVVVV